MISRFFKEEELLYISDKDDMDLGFCGAYGCGLRGKSTRIKLEPL